MQSGYSATVLFCAVTLTACSDASPAGVDHQDAAPLLRAPAGHRVEGSYIVVLSRGADPRSITAGAGVRPRHVYTAALTGFAAALNEAQVTALRHNPNVEYIEEEQVTKVQATQYNPPWGLDRIDQRNQPLSGTFTYNKNGAGVYVYVIDTGLQANHPEFGGRAQNVFDYEGGTGQDCHGHGTHVAGTVGSVTFGVAKGVSLRGVRVMGCSGSGQSGDVVAGVDWVRNNHVKPAVANVSLVFPHSSAINAATANMVEAGVFTAVCSGNYDQNACNYSPASASGVLTVNAVNSLDQKAEFSNYGSCTDIYAPGVNVSSTWIGSGYKSYSGTSMASPHAAGVGALYKSTFGDDQSSEIVSWIRNVATSNAVSGNPTGTPNRLLYINLNVHNQGGGG